MAERRMKAPLVGPVRIRGRTFSLDELSRIKAIVEGSPEAHRLALSKKVCEVLEWRQINGRLKDRSCRDVLLKLHEVGFLRLPPPRRPPTHRRPITITGNTDPTLTAAFGPRDIDLQSFSIVTGSGQRGSRPEERLWNEFVERYHYLRYGVPVGPQIKYFVRFRDQPIACLAFGGAAWKVAARDQWIGWSHEQREAQLRYVVNNTRFLIFPWVQVKNLASRILALAAKRLPRDWSRLYGYSPLLLETFVHVGKHAGTCYRAANWVPVGETKGRGRMDRHQKAALPRKLVFLYPLVTGLAARLSSSKL